MELFELVKETLFNIIEEDVTYTSKGFDYSNEKFCIGYLKNSCEVCVWADDGNTSIYNEEHISDIDSISCVIANVITDWQTGYIRCSDCGKRIKKSEVAGQYFAGRYCHDCWSNTWCKIEAKETYE